MRRLHPVLLGALLLATTAGSLSGCGNQSQRNQPRMYEFGLQVELTTPDGEPISGAPVVLDGRTVGYTDRDGAFRATLRERPGRSVEFSLGDVDGYRYVEEPALAEPLRVKRNLSGPGRKGVPVVLRAEAESTTVPYLVWVRARCDKNSLDLVDCKGLDVLRDGERVATTDRTGMAHFTLEEKPGTEIALTLDTPDEGTDDAPSLQPADPEFSFELSTNPHVYLLDQKFRNASDEEDKGSWEPPTRPAPPPKTTSSSDSSKSGDSDGSASHSENDTDDEDDDSGDSPSDDEAGTGWDDLAPTGDVPSDDTSEDESKKDKDGPIKLF